MDCLVDSNIDSKSSFWETKYRSAEKSIEFLQIEHTQTLKYLHDQIEGLQKQCADLSFRLSIHATTQLEKDEFEKLQKQFDTSVKQKDDSLREQSEIIDEKNLIIKDLQDKLNLLERKLDVESKFKDDTIRQLRIQVDQQSAKVAELSFQIHSLNLNRLKSGSTIQQTPNNNETKSLKPIIVTSNKNQNPFKQILISNKKQSNDSKQFIKILHDKPVITFNRRDSVSSGKSSIDQNKPAKLQPIKALPFEDLRRNSVDAPDPTPFLMQNIVVARNNDLFTKRKFEALPPIKASNGKINEFVVDSPYKHNSFLSQLSDTHNN